VDETPEVEARSASRPVFLRGGTESSDMVGALRATRSATGVARADLRPLALGPGRFRLTLLVKAGKQKRKVRKVVELGRNEASPRLRAKIAGATGSTKIVLRVQRRAGSRWRAHASARIRFSSGDPPGR
jgi:hypothetical protein